MIAASTRPMSIESIERKIMLFIFDDLDSKNMQANKVRSPLETPTA